MKCESIFDILSLKSIQEADGEEQSSPQQNDNDLGNIDDDFDIDTSLDDVGSENSGEDAQDNSTEDSSGDTPSDGSDVGSESDAGAPAGDNTSMDEEEPVESNTDIFASLTAEEQKIKIKELKNLFGNLYSSCDEILSRIDKLDLNEDNLDSLSRISSTIYDMKIYISDYLNMVFPTKSYIENDVVFVRFLTIIKSITEILDDIGKKYKRDVEKDLNYSKNE